MPKRVSPHKKSVCVPYLWKASLSLKPPKLEILSSFIFNPLSSPLLLIPVSHQVMAIGNAFYFLQMFSPFY